MSLSEYQFPTKKVTGGLTVRGLTFIDISALTHEHYDLLSKVFDGIKVDDDIDIKKIVGKFAPAMPPLAASIIACGCDEPARIDLASKLPFGTQIEALQKIGELTFATEGGVKAVFQMVMAAMQQTTDAVTVLNS